MKTAFLLSIVMMAGLFLMLYAGVGLIQEKKYFTSAPKELQDLIPEHIPERFHGAHILGWILMIFSIVLLLTAVMYAGYDGVHNHFTFLQLFIRYLVMFFLLKVFDIVFFDLYLLCNSGFYPQVNGHTDMHLFGFNAKSHIIKTLVCIPLSLLLAWICTLL